MTTPRSITGLPCWQTPGRTRLWEVRAPRADAQFHFVTLHDVEAAMRILADAGLTTRETCGNSVRNITFGGHNALPVAPSVQLFAAAKIQNRLRRLRARDSQGRAYPAARDLRLRRTRSVMWRICHDSMAEPSGEDAIDGHRRIQQQHKLHRRSISRGGKIQCVDSGEGCGYAPEDRCTGH
jgi:hypothetical protein